MVRSFCASLLLAVLLGGCAGIPFEAPVLGPTRQLTAAELLEPFWLGEAATYRIRQSGLFQLRGMKLPIEGFMELDAGSRYARLVALEGMGLKLFDLTVTADTVEVHHLLPDLRRHPGLAEAVADSVRRIFFLPQPSSADRLEIASRDYRLRRSGSDEVTFVFGGEPPLLLEKRSQGPSGDWQVGYYQYREMTGRLIPEGIFLQDRRAGYTLTLWLESVKSIEK
ncbi:hypothetical protein [Trichloromonas sp.]|uniref:hypothetical protein n=1 Tax=Trichloromonas sp. TaxID=3069249 RepID=UPI003D8152F2